MNTSRMVSLLVSSLIKTTNRITQILKNTSQEVAKFAIQ